MTRYSIRKEDVKFVVNKEKRTVICYIEGTKNIFMDFVYNNFSLGYNTHMDYNKLILPNRFIGKATCAAGDEWDEEKGKLLAYDRMKNEINEKFRRAAQYYVNWYDKELASAVNITNEYCNKLYHNKERRQAILCDMFSDKE